VAFGLVVEAVARAADRGTLAVFERLLDRPSTNVPLGGLGVDVAVDFVALGAHDPSPCVVRAPQPPLMYRSMHEHPITECQPADTREDCSVESSTRRHRAQVQPLLVEDAHRTPVEGDKTAVLQ
jgi:hypothetical protein